jgi:hypothetical protein
MCQFLSSSFEGYISVTSGWGLSNGGPLNIASLTMNFYRSKHVVVTDVVSDYLLRIVQVVELSTVKTVIPCFYLGRDTGYVFCKKNETVDV